MAAQATSTEPASLKKPGRTTPHSGATQSRASPPSAVSNSSTAIVPSEPLTGIPPSVSALTSPRSSEGGHDLVGEKAVAGDRAAPVDPGRAGQVGEAAARLLDDDLEGGDAPHLDRRLHRGADGTP